MERSDILRWVYAKDFFVETMPDRVSRLFDLAQTQDATIVDITATNVVFECSCGERHTKRLTTTSLYCNRHTQQRSQLKRSGCCRFETFKFPSGREVRIHKGCEGVALTELVKLYKEDDIETTPEPISYTFNGKLHTYIPDIYIKSRNLIIEVKSDRSMYYTGEYGVNLAKRKATEESGYNFEFWIYDKCTKTIL